MGRPFDRHIDNKELRALVPSPSETGQDAPALSPDALREAERHVGSCRACSRKASKYWQLVNGFSNVAVSEGAAPGTDCPKDKDVDWGEVAAGLWPELKTTQLIMHAALCDHCGPLLRAAASVNDGPTPQEDKRLTELMAPSRSALKPKGELAPFVFLRPPFSQPFLRWKMFVPALAVMVIVGVLGTRPPSAPTTVSGSKFAELAVRTHRQQAQGKLALELRSDSAQALNEWVKAKSQFSLALPVSPAIPGEERPYRLEGGRLVPIGGRTAVYIAYQMQTGLVSLMVTPDSVAVASGGVVVDFTKVSFHYATVEGYKVVTWSVHGLTYALVSREGNNTQRSCMVCHSAMRDRDLSQTPAPLRAERNTVEPVWQ